MHISHRTIFCAGMARLRGQAQFLQCAGQRRDSNASQRVAGQGQVYFHGAQAHARAGRVSD